MPEIFPPGDYMHFIDTCLRFAATFPMRGLRAPLHLHLASFAIQQMALEAVS